MEIHSLTETGNAAMPPVAMRQPEKMVESLARTETDPRQDDAMLPGANRSQAGLVAEAMLNARPQNAGAAPEVAQPERVLKPWGIAMLPDDSRDKAGEGDTGLEPPAGSAASAETEQPEPTGA